MTDFTLGPGPLTPEFEQVKSDIGIVENGNTATHAIPAGYYVIWKGDLYVAKMDISSGTTLSAASGGNLTAKTSGIGADVASLSSKIGTVPSGQTVEGQITSLNTNFKNRIGILADEMLSASKTFTFPTSGLYLILCRANANSTTNSPEISITTSTQTAKNIGSAGGSVFVHMLAYQGGNTTVTITCSNYTSGGTYNIYGRITILRIADLPNTISS